MEVNRIYNEDCLKTMSRMADGSVDLIVTSPPYNKNFYASASGDGKSWGALRGRQIAYDTYSDAMEPEAYADWQKRVLKECLRILKPTGSIFYNHKDILSDGVVIHPTWVYDFAVHQIIIWNRGSSLANDPHYFQPITEYIYWIAKSPKEMYFDKSRATFRQNVWNINFEIGTEHPAPFPKTLAGNVIQACCPRGGVCYDPFMGSGTTAVMAMEFGCDYIGSEISAEYCAFAEKRIGVKEAQPSLF